MKKIHVSTSKVETGVKLAFHSGRYLSLFDQSSSDRKAKATIVARLGLRLDSVSSTYIVIQRIRVSSGYRDQVVSVLPRYNVSQLLLRINDKTVKVKTNTY